MKMPDNDYRLIGKDDMEPSILSRTLRPWRRHDQDRAHRLVEDVLSVGHIVSLEQKFHSC